MVHCVCIILYVGLCCLCNTISQALT